MSITTNMRKYSDYKQTRNILLDRKRTTYLLDGIQSVKFDDKKPNSLKIGYIVKETDELGYGTYSSDIVKEFYTPKYVTNHLFGMLDIPTRLYDYIYAFKRLEESEMDIALANFSDNLQMLMNYRIKQQEKNSRMRKHYITIFSDVFGTFPRVIRSEIYRPYKDSKALEDFNKNLKTLNKNSNSHFYFKRARLTPYRSTFEYLNANSEDTLKHKGDKISHGVINFNSETKDSSNGFQYLIMRMVCSNGLISTFKENDIRVRHLGDDFQIRSKKAFITCLKLGQKFAKMFYELDKKATEISNDWNDINDIPSSILPMRQNEKNELIEIAQKEDYKLDAYGLVQALTYKSNHNTNSDKGFERLNEKGIEIMKNPNKVNAWIQKTNKRKEEAKNNIPKQKDDTNVFDVSDLEFM